MTKLEQLKEELSAQHDKLPVSFHYLTFREADDPVVQKNTSGAYVKSNFHQTDELRVASFFKPISRCMDFRENKG